MACVDGGRREADFVAPVIVVVDDEAAAERVEAVQLVEGFDAGHFGLVGGEAPVGGRGDGEGGVFADAQDVCF